MIRRFFLFLFISVVISFFSTNKVLATTAPPPANGVTLTTDPAPDQATNKIHINYGDPVHINLSNIEKSVGDSGQKLYRVLVSTDQNASTGNIKTLVNIFIQLDTGDNTYSCVWEFNDGTRTKPSGGGFTNTNCADGDTFTFTTTLDTTKIGAQQNSNQPQEYWLLAEGSNTSNDTLSRFAGSQMEIAPASPSATCQTFNIKGIKDVNKNDISIDSLNAGDGFYVVFSPFIDGKKYSAWLTTDHKVDTKCTGTSDCISSDYLTISQNASYNATITLFAQSEDGESCSKELTIADSTPLTNQISEKEKFTLPDKDQLYPVCNKWFKIIGKEKQIIPNPPPKKDDGTLDVDGCAEVNTAIGPVNTNAVSIIGSIFSKILGLAGGIALLLIIRSGYQMMTSQGNPEAVKGARDILTAAIVGLLFIIFSFVILQVIGVNILQIPGFS